VPTLGGKPQEILCEHFERQVWADNCVSFQNLKLQIPKQGHRCHFVKLKQFYLLRTENECIRLARRPARVPIATAIRIFQGSLM
jgi:hypothetical protein